MKVLLERDGAITAADNVLEQARAGRAGVLFILAEAGLGKTSVLARARSRAAELGFAVGLGRGEATETALPFGLVAQALDGLGGGPVLEAPDTGPPGQDLRAARFYAVRRWLEHCGPRPVLIALDDLHWADADSLGLLSFLGRRIARLPVAIIATLRPWPPAAQQVAAGLAAGGDAALARLDPLTPPGAADLLGARAGDRASAADISRAAGLCAGNPLLLEQAALTLASGAPVISADRLLLARFAGLPPVGLRCARAAAVFGTRFRPDLAVRLAGLGQRQGDEAIEALELSGLARAAPAGSTEFVHPLFRQALYDDLGGTLRTRLHARAFTLLVRRGLREEAVEHAVKADLAGDRTAIAVLEQVGRAARRRGATGTALSVLESAVGLAADDASPGLLCELAETMASGGRPADAARICERLLDRTADLPQELRARALRTLAQALVFLGAFDAGERRVRECVDLIAADDPFFAVETLLGYGLVSWLVSGPGATLPVHARARELAGPGDPLVRGAAEAAWAVTALETGDASGVPACESAARAAARQADSAAGPAFFAGAGALASWATGSRYVERLTESARYYDLHLRTAEQLGVVEQEVAALVGYIDTLLRLLRLDQAEAVAQRCAQLADLVPLASPFAQVGLANVLLLRGRLADSEESGRQAEAAISVIGAWPPQLRLAYGRAWRDLTEGRPDDACLGYAEIESVSARIGLREPCEVPWAGHGIAAYLRAGRRADAERVIGWLEDCASGLPCRWPRLTADYGRALLAEADGDQARADGYFRVALARHAEVSLPLERFQMLLEYGRFLRRTGQVRQARPPLARAAALAEAAGAHWLAGQALAELRVAGGRRRRPDDDPRRLTPQEERVAQLAAAGATNPEIASQLSVSVRTIETHLEHTFVKLGIASRRDLRAALADRKA